MLDLHSIHFSYDDVEVLKGISLQLESGKIHGLAGMNGSGKTTLLQVVYGLLKPQNGDIRFKGKPVQMEETVFLEAGNYFYHRLTTKETLQLFSIANPSFEIDRWLEVFSLSGKEFTEDLSTGMRKKLAILCALAKDKELMLLDEPFNGLDMESVMVLHAVLKELRKKGKTILITSHILETLLENCDSIQTFAEGRIIQSYLPAEYDQMKKDFFVGLEEKLEVSIGALMQ
jgi:ABC-2 type transport system ATP-binding protein